MKENEKKKEERKAMEGVIDLHIHAGPSVMPRETDAVEMLKEAEEQGYRAFVVKDHYAPTVMTAALLEKHMRRSDTRVFGGIALNNSVGGLNVKALDAACAMGARIFWMPTVSTAHHIESHSGHGVKFPSSKGMSVPEKALRYVDERGKLIPEATAVLKYAAENKELILGTGHGSLEEVDAVVMTAAELGIEKILVNHPFYMVGADMAHMKKWAEAGAYIELNATVFVPESNFCAVSMDVAGEILEQIPLERLVVDSDYGQKGNGGVSQGLMSFMELLKEQCGATDEQIGCMTRINPARLLGLELLGLES